MINTKKISLVAIILLSTLSSSIAQSNVSVGIAPLGLRGKLAITAEIESKSKWSFAPSFTHNYFNMWEGYKTEVGLRYYFESLKDTNSFDGFYAVLQPGVGSYKTPYKVNDGRSSLFFEHIVYRPNERTAAQGVGLGLGYKKSLKRWHLDVNFRYQHWSTKTKPTLYEKNFNQVTSYVPINGRDRLSWSLYGPGSFIAPTLIFGWRLNK